MTEELHSRLADLRLRAASERAQRLEETAREVVARAYAEADAVRTTVRRDREVAASDARQTLGRLLDEGDRFLGALADIATEAAGLADRTLALFGALQRVTDEAERLERRDSASR